MALEFQPAVLSGGKLSLEDYEDRKRQCTQDALASLQKSVAFKQWQQQRQKRSPILVTYPTVASAAVALTLLLAASAAAYGYWSSKASSRLESQETAGVPIAATSKLPSQEPDVGAESSHPAAGEHSDAAFPNLTAAPSALEQQTTQLESGPGVTAPEAVASADGGQLEDSAPLEAPRADTEAAVPPDSDSEWEAVPLEDIEESPAVVGDLSSSQVAIAETRVQKLEAELQQAAAQHLQELEQLRAQAAWQAQDYEQRLSQLQQYSGQHAEAYKVLQQQSTQQADQWAQRLSELQQVLEKEQGITAALSRKLGASEAMLIQLRLNNTALQEELAQQATAGLAIAAAEDTAIRFSEGNCDTESVAPLLGALPELYLACSAATLLLLGAAAAWRLHVRRAAGTLRAATLAQALEQANLKVAQLEQTIKDLEQESSAELALTVQARNEAFGERDTLAVQLKSARAEAAASAAQAQQAHQTLLQVQTELEEQLQAAKEAAAQKAAEAAEVQGQLEEQREWQTAAQQLASYSSAAFNAACLSKPSASTSAASSPRFGCSPRVGSPTKRTPFAARSRNGSAYHLLPNGRQAGRDENSPALSTPPGQTLSPGPPSIAAAAAAALGAKVPDNPRAWLEVLQARFAALREQAVATERAALDADATLEAVKKETSWSQQKVSEVTTDNELLKERLLDAKRELQAASTAEQQAREVVAALQARAGVLEQQAAASKLDQEELQRQLHAAEAASADLQQRLAAAYSQMDLLQQQLAEAQSQQGSPAGGVGGGSNVERVQQLQEALAAKEKEAGELQQAVDELERENSSLEAQADQVTASLAHTQQQKSQLETKVAHLEQELAGLNIMAEKLEGDKAVLEEQLDKARRANAELCAAGKQLAAAETTIRENTLMDRAATPDGDIDLRRAITEKVAALDMLASAEKKMLEREAADDLGPLPMNSPVRSLSRFSSSTYEEMVSPRTRGSKIVNYFSTKIEKVARLMSGDLGVERGSLPDTPQSRASGLGGTQGGGDRSALRGAHVNGNMTAWFDRLNQSFNSVGKVLHQDLSGFETPRSVGGSKASPRRTHEQQDGMERTQEALEYSAQEVVEILAAMDAAEQMEGPDGSVAAAREELHGAHMAVQEALREVQGYSMEIAQRKKAHRDIVQEVQRLNGQVEFANEMVETELQRKAQIEDKVARAQELLTAAQQELDYAQDRKEAAEAELAMEHPDLNFDDAQGLEELPVESGEWQAWVQANEEYDRCMEQHLACYRELQAALETKRDTIDRMAAASNRLAEAEVQLEETAGTLDQIEADLNALTQQHLQLVDALQQQQARQAAALQVAVHVLERCLSPDGVDEDELAGDGAEEPARQGSSEAALVAAHLSPAQENNSATKPARTASTSGSQSAVLSPAEVAAELLEDGWWTAPRSSGSKLSRHSTIDSL